MSWTKNDIPDLTGKEVIVTGANTGLGKETARVLVQKGANVTIAVRNQLKGEDAVQELKSAAPDTKVELRLLDLSDLDSIKSFAQGYLADKTRLDLLVNNAGVMIPPLSHTNAGFELQMGTNHFGHFALTAQLWPLLKATEDSRLVVLASIAHKQGNINFDDIDWKTRKYKAMSAYGDSKLANLYFAYELARRVGEDGPKVVAAHPGWTGTDLQRHSGFVEFLNRFFSMDVEDGAQPTLRAAFDPTAQPGDYFGPNGWQEMKGKPVKVSSNKRSMDREIATRLFDLSEQRTGVSFDL